ncbi:hypothetical protein ACHAXA_004920 [Cyclostephanos tholiformis]|uniref:Peroxisomal membrane protein 2 n=1 Tax=Cyclostephanos tholiformis TaxID=382380 RepID=A0ABD3RS51_9STRA
MVQSFATSLLILLLPGLVQCRFACAFTYPRRPVITRGTSTNPPRRRILRTDDNVATLSFPSSSVDASTESPPSRPPHRPPETRIYLTGGFEDAWSSYLSALEADPLLVKSVTAGVILGAADLSGQAIQRATASATASAEEDYDHDDDDDDAGGGEGGVDVARFARFALFGFALQAPWNHFYYQLLDGALPPTSDPYTATTAIKVVIDQFVQAPIFTIVIFVFLGLLEGRTVGEIKERLDEDYVDTMLANWKLWVPATAVNIAFCPPILRVLFLNVVFFFWSIFLSLKLNKKDE